MSGSSDQSRKPGADKKCSNDDTDTATTRTARNTKVDANPVGIGPGEKKADDIHHLDLEQVNKNFGDKMEENMQTLYVSNLHPRIAEAHLHKLFGKYGIIIRIHFARKPKFKKTGGHYTYAFVQYQTSNAARDALHQLNGQILLGERIIVRYANSERKGLDYSGASAVFRSSISAKRPGSDLDAEKKVKKLKSDVQKKIEAVKKALAGKK